MKTRMFAKLLGGLIFNPLTRKPINLLMYKNMFKKLTILLGTLIILVSGVNLTSDIRHLVSVDTANGLLLSTNTANVEWTDNQNNVYLPASDTAIIRILSAPTLSIAKGVRNIRTGEFSQDTVQAVRGDSMEFILVIENSGDTEANDVVIADSIPISTEYIQGSALDSMSLDPIGPPDTITFQHIEGGIYDETDILPVVAIKWEWSSIGGISGYNTRTIKFKVRIRED